MPLKKGEMKVNGSIAYCAQQPWIQNATLKDNMHCAEEYLKFCL